MNNTSMITWHKFREIPKESGYYLVSVKWEEGFTNGKRKISRYVEKANFVTEQDARKYASIEGVKRETNIWVLPDVYGDTTVIEINNSTVDYEYDKPDYMSSFTIEAWAEMPESVSEEFLNS